MISVGKTLISDDIKESFFLCHLEKCKGACCVEGDLGAPLEEEELSIIDAIYPVVKPYLSQEGVKAIDTQGCHLLDEEGDYSTTTIGGKECSFAVYDDNGILKCGFEKAFLDGKTTFRKPLSCHLYPIRVTKYDDYDALNYDQWKICSDACVLGESMNLPLYKFLKESLIRKYGEQWYLELCAAIENPPIQAS